MSLGVIRQPDLKLSSEQNDGFHSFSRHSAKPHVGGSVLYFCRGNSSSVSVSAEKMSMMLPVCSFNGVI
jgi:hypothetical protein